eukprot:gene6562-7607_t
MDALLAHKAQQQGFYPTTTNTGPPVYSSASQIQQQQGFYPLPPPHSTTTAKQVPFTNSHLQSSLPPAPAAVVQLTNTHTPAAQTVTTTMAPPTRIPRNLKVLKPRAKSSLDVLASAAVLSSLPSQPVNQTATTPMIVVPPRVVSSTTSTRPSTIIPPPRLVWATPSVKIEKVNTPPATTTTTTTTTTTMINNNCTVPPVKIEQKPLPVKGIVIVDDEPTPSATAPLPLPIAVTPPLPIAATPSPIPIPSMVIPPIKVEQIRRPVKETPTNNLEKVQEIAEVPVVIPSVDTTMTDVTMTESIQSLSSSPQAMPTTHSDVVSSTDDRVIVDEPVHQSSPGPQVMTTTHSDVVEVTAEAFLVFIPPVDTTMTDVTMSEPIQSSSPQVIPTTHSDIAQEAVPVAIPSVDTTTESTQSLLCRPQTPPAISTDDRAIVDEPVHQSSPGPQAISTTHSDDLVQETVEAVIPSVDKIIPVTPEHTQSPSSSPKTPSAVSTDDQAIIMTHSDVVEATTVTDVTMTEPIQSPSSHFDEVVQEPVDESPVPESTSPQTPPVANSGEMVQETVEVLPVVFQSIVEIIPDTNVVQSDEPMIDDPKETLTDTQISTCQEQVNSMNGDGSAVQDDDEMDDIMSDFYSSIPPSPPNTPSVPFVTPSSTPSTATSMITSPPPSPTLPSSSSSTTTTPPTSISPTNAKSIPTQPSTPSSTATTPPSTSAESISPVVVSLQTVSIHLAKVASPIRPTQPALSVIKISSTVTPSSPSSSASQQSVSPPLSAKVSSPTKATPIKPIQPAVSVIKSTPSSPQPSTSTNTTPGITTPRKPLVTSTVTPFSQSTQPSRSAQLSVKVPSIFNRSKPIEKNYVAPTEYGLLKNILSWDTVTTVDDSDLQPVPTVFRGVDDYISIFQSQLLNEFKLHIIRCICDQRVKEGPTSNVLDVTRDGNFLLIDLGVPSNTTMSSYDLAIVHHIMDDGQSVKIYAKIDKIVRRPYGRSYAVARVNRLDHLPYWSKLMIGSIWYVRRITSLSVLVKEYMSLVSIVGSPLSEVLVKPIQPKNKNIAVPIEIPSALLSVIKSRLNKSQMDVVYAATDARGITLVHGSAGTGKTHVLISLLSVLLATPKDAKQPPKILICTPSDSALDEIAKRILSFDCADASGLPFSPNIIRMGSTSSTNPKIQAISMDVLMGIMRKVGLETDSQSIKSRCIETFSVFKDVQTRIDELLVMLANHEPGDQPSESITMELASLYTLRTSILNDMMNGVSSSTSAQLEAVTSMSIGVITLFRSQVTEIQEQLSAYLKPFIEVSTIDGMQGTEKDIIIFSCVRGHTDVLPPPSTFLGDVRLMNIALTRAKKSMIVIGNSKALQSSSEWSELVNYAKISHNGYFGMIQTSHQMIYATLPIFIRNGDIQVIVSGQLSNLYKLLVMPVVNSVTNAPTDGGVITISGQYLNGLRQDDSNTDIVVNIGDHLCASPTFLDSTTANEITCTLPDAEIQDGVISVTIDGVTGITMSRYITEYSSRSQKVMGDTKEHNFIKTSWTIRDYWYFGIHRDNIFSPWIYSSGPEAGYPVYESFPAARCYDYCDWYTFEPNIWTNPVEYYAMSSELSWSAVPGIDAYLYVVEWGGLEEPFIPSMNTAGGRVNITRLFNYKLEGMTVKVTYPNGTSILITDGIPFNNNTLLINMPPRSGDGYIRVEIKDVNGKTVTIDRYKYQLPYIESIYPATPGQPVTITGDNFGSNSTQLTSTIEMDVSFTGDYTGGYSCDSVNIIVPHKMFTCDVRYAPNTTSEFLPLQVTVSGATQATKRSMFYDRVRLRMVMVDVSIAQKIPEASGAKFEGYPGYIGPIQTMDQMYLIRTFVEPDDGGTYSSETFQGVVYRTVSTTYAVAGWYLVGTNANPVIDKEGNCDSKRIACTTFTEGKADWRDGHKLIYRPMIGVNGSFGYETLYSGVMIFYGRDPVCSSPLVTPYLFPTSGGILSLNVENNGFSLTKRSLYLGGNLYQTNMVINMTHIDVTINPGAGAPLQSTVKIEEFSIVVIGDVPCTGIIIVTAHSSFTCNLPAGTGTSKNVVITVGNQTPSGSVIFNYLPPNITSIVQIGSTLTIIGNDFGALETTVTLPTDFGMIQTSHQMIYATLPSFIRNGDIQVIVSGQLSNLYKLSVMPVVNSVTNTPTDRGVITISGQYLNDLRQDDSNTDILVNIGDHLCSSPTVLDSTTAKEITCTLPDVEIQDGVISVTIDGVTGIAMSRYTSLSIPVDSKRSWVIPVITVATVIGASLIAVVIYLAKKKRHSRWLGMTNEKNNGTRMNPLYSENPNVVSNQLFDSTDMNGQ